MGTATDNPSQFSHSAERAEACSDIVFYLSGPLHSCQELEREEEREREREVVGQRVEEREKKDGELRRDRAK